MQLNLHFKCFNIYIPEGKDSKRDGSKSDQHEENVPSHEAETCNNILLGYKHKLLSVHTKSRRLFKVINGIFCPTVTWVINIKCNCLLTPCWPVLFFPRSTGV